MSMYIKRDVGEMSEVRRSGGELCLQWKIPRFMDLTFGMGDFYTSPFFSFSDACWHLVLKPNFKTSDGVSLDIRRDDVGTSTKIMNVVLSVEASGVVKKMKERVKAGFRQHGRWGVSNFCSKSELREQRLMTEGALTIVCELKACSATARDTEKLSEDLASLLASGERSDVTVRVDGEEFQLHSAILAVRCPALTVSLRHESAERASNRIVVEDCEADIFRLFLHFLYTGTVHSLTKDNVFALYRIADRYLVDGLKQWCLDRMQDAMSVETFCDAVRLAATHGENGLMDRAIAFATENIQSVLSSEEWRNFNRECPDEANEVLLKFVVPPCKRQKS